MWDYEQKDKMESKVFLLSFGIMVVSLAIIFNIADILKEESISGFAVSEENVFNQSEMQNHSMQQNLNENLYSEKSYMIYYLIITFIGIFIAIVTIRIIFPKIKEYT